MALPAEAIDLIKRFEGCLKRIADGRYKPYLCPASVPTVGWGTTRYPEGRRVMLSDTPVTQSQADDFLLHEVASNERAFDALTTRTIPALSRGAIVSFIYNCGSGAYRASTLRRRINEGRWADVPRELAKWRVGGGRVLAGLIRRRAEEAALFMKGVNEIANSAAPVIRPENPKERVPAQPPNRGAPVPAKIPLPPTPSWSWRSLLDKLGWQ